MLPSGTSDSAFTREGLSPELYKNSFKTGDVLIYLNTICFILSSPPGKKLRLTKVSVLERDRQVKMNACRWTNGLVRTSDKKWG